jgi:hypothetical protein
VDDMNYRLGCIAWVWLCGCGPGKGSEDPASEGSSGGSTGAPTTAGESGSPTTGASTEVAESGTTTGTSTGDESGTGTSTGTGESVLLGCAGLAPDVMVPASSTLDGAIVSAVGAGARFEVPAQWLQWQAEHGHNLHLSRPELEAVRVGVGDWDTEYAHVLAGLFNYDCCAAHVGGDSWAGGVSYDDLQMRVYVLEDLPVDIVARALSTSWELVTPKVTVEEGDPWTRVLIHYTVWYGDYGGDAFVDLRLRRYEAATIVYAGMYSGDFDAEAEFDAIVAGECWTPGTGECL